MKKDIHPEWHADAKVIVDGEVVMTVGSTHPELHVDIWSGNHPFYTGKQKLVDTARRVEKFEAKMAQKTEGATSKAAKKAALKEKRNTKVAVRTEPQKLGSKRVSANAKAKKSEKTAAPKNDAPVAQADDQAQDNQ